MHLSRRFGATLSFIEADGFRPAATLDWLAPEREGRSVTEETARALDLIGSALESSIPDALVIVGDRSETAAAALAATVLRIPIAHIHGGEETLGAFDNAIRHAITKLAHLHLVSSHAHGQRVRALGEAPEAIHVVGAPGLDNLFRSDLADRAELEATLGLELRAPVIVVTVHPATLDSDPSAVAACVAEAMTRVAATYVVTLPNVDPGGQRVRRLLRRAAQMADGIAVEALGERRYWGLLRIADAMLGNSSSGLIEAPALGLPVVNVGDRQAGRSHGATVVDVPLDAKEIATALAAVLDRIQVSGQLRTMPPGIDGRIGERIADILVAWDPGFPPRKAAIVVPS